MYSNRSTKINKHPKLMNIKAEFNSAIITVGAIFFFFLKQDLLEVCVRRLAVPGKAAAL